MMKGKKLIVFLMAVCMMISMSFGMVAEAATTAASTQERAELMAGKAYTIKKGKSAVLTENLGYYIGLYDTWSSYGVETDGVVIAYTSVYGHTKEAAELLAKKLTEKGCPKVAVNDLARCDMAEAVEDAFRYGKLVLATTTYNGDIFPFMREFINHLTERNFQNRTIGLIENGAWAPMAAKVMKGMFENSKNLTFTDTTVQIKAALNDASLAQIDALADELCK